MYSILIWLISIIVFNIAIIVYIGGNNLSSRFFAYCMLFVTLWIAGVGLLISSNNPVFALINLRVNYLIGDLIALYFLYFFIVFPNDKKINSKLNVLFILSQALLLYVFIFTNLIIDNVYKINSISYWSWGFGKLSIIFELIFFVSFIYGLVLLISKYNNEKSLTNRLNLKYMIYTILIGSIIPTITCIILPRIGIYNYNWIGPIGEIFWIPFFTFSVIKYKQMNINLILAEIIIVCIIIIFFVNMFIDLATGLFFKSVLFIIFIFLNIYLIKISIREAIAKISLSSLNSHLEDRVKEQTLEIQTAYEIEKKHRRDLEKLNSTKDQFILITQHNLRTPVSNIRNSLSSMFSGSLGVINSEINNSLKNIDISAKRLINIIDDFLEITNLKVSTKILRVKSGNIMNTINQIIGELTLELKKKNINIIIDNNLTYEIDFKFDISKIHEAFTILIENSIKYNKENGSININLNFFNNDIIIKITDTGIGITASEKDSLFTKSFYRSKRAQIYNPIGMGIGLQLARSIIRGHKGELILDSPGENMGTIVTVTLPI